MNVIYGYPLVQMSFMDRQLTTLDFIYVRAQDIYITCSPQATVTTVWKTPICKRGILKCPVSYVLNFRGWIRLIYDKITLIYSVKNAFDPTSEVQNIEFGVLQNAPFANAQLANGHLPNGDYSCLWAFSSFLIIVFAQRQLQSPFGKWKIAKGAF